MKVKHIASAILLAAITAACGGTQNNASQGLALKDVVADQFLMGTAINVRQAAGLDTSATNIVKKHFNAIVADDADNFVKFGEENGLTMTGHVLIWHSQCPDWFCVDKNGKNVSPEVLKQRMKTHITTVVQHFKGKLKGWDVVNEAILEDGSYRKSKFYEILGEEFIPLAFQYAHEADSTIELYYNDYGMDNPGRREGVVKLIRSLKEKGLRIDAVGMQGHMGMDYPKIEEFEKSMLAFAQEGVKVMITEWDMSALPTVSRTANISDTVAFQKALNPYPNELPD